MSRARLKTAGILLFAVLAFPRDGSAYYLDIIWQMSGPQLIGGVFLHCRIDVSSGASECRSFDRRISGGLDGLAGHRAWVSFESAYYLSTGYNAENVEGITDDYRAWRTRMLAIEPILEIRSGTKWGATFYHGLVGLTYDILHGQDFDTFDKVGLKFRPIAAAFKNIDLAFNVRVYPNGFGRDEFGFEPRLGDVDRPAEAVYGASIGLRW